MRILCLIPILIELQLIIREIEGCVLRCGKGDDNVTAILRVDTLFLFIIFFKFS